MRTRLWLLRGYWAAKRESPQPLPGGRQRRLGRGGGEQGMERDGRRLQQDRRASRAGRGSRGPGREDGQSPGRAERGARAGTRSPRVSSASRGAGGGNRRGGRRGRRRGLEDSGKETQGPTLRPSCPGPRNAVLVLAVARTSSPRGAGAAGFHPPPPAGLGTKRPWAWGKGSMAGPGGPHACTVGSPLVAHPRGSL